MDQIHDKSYAFYTFNVCHSSGISNINAAKQILSNLNNVTIFDSIKSHIVKINSYIDKSYEIKINQCDKIVISKFNDEIINKKLSDEIDHKPKIDYKNISKIIIDNVPEDNNLSKYLSYIRYLPFIQKYIIGINGHESNYSHKSFNKIFTDDVWDLNISFINRIVKKGSNTSICDAMSKHCIKYSKESSKESLIKHLEKNIIMILSSEDNNYTAVFYKKGNISEVVPLNIGIIFMERQCGYNIGRIVSKLYSIQEYNNYKPCALPIVFMNSIITNNLQHGYKNIKRLVVDESFKYIIETLVLQIAYCLYSSNINKSLVQPLDETKNNTGMSLIVYLYIQSLFKYGVMYCKFSDIKRNLEAKNIMKRNNHPMCMYRHIYILIMINFIKDSLQNNLYKSNIKQLFRHYDSWHRLGFFKSKKIFIATKICEEFFHKNYNM